MKERLVDKYRPQKIEDYIFPNERSEKMVKSWITDGIIPHVLMVSKPGQGKTSLAQVLINELGINEGDVKRFNASTERGIGFIRESLEPWLRKMPIGDFKIVQMEEMDQLTRDASLALRGIIEDYSDTVRFIGTANYETKIDPALLSRFEDGRIDMNGITLDTIIDLVVHIIEEEGITFGDDDDPEEIILAHIDQYSPDIRRIISSIDASSKNDEKILTYPSKAESVDDLDEWESVWVDGDPDPLRLLNLTELVNSDNYEFFYEVMYNFVNKTKDSSQIAKRVVLISEYLHRAKTESANQRIHLDACIYRMFFMED